MKRIHLYGPSIRYTYTTICGLQISDTYLDTTNRKKVTCKRCLRTMRKKNKMKKVIHYMRRWQGTFPKTLCGHQGWGWCGLPYTGIKAKVTCCNCKHILKGKNA